MAQFLSKCNSRKVACPEIAVSSTSFIRAWNVVVAVFVILWSVFASLPCLADRANASGELVWNDRSYTFDLTAAESRNNPVVNHSFEELSEKNLPAVWQYESNNYVSVTDAGCDGKHAIKLRSDGDKSGIVSQVIDVSKLAGQKLFLRYRAKASGSVVPYFKIELVDDGEVVKVPAAGGMKDTTVLAELHKFGWWPYDGHYGWLFWNDHLPMLFKDTWQTLGGVFTVPKGTGRVKISFEPKAARYNALERRKVLVGSGEITIDSVEVGPTKRQLFADKISKSANEWQGFTYNADEFCYLSFIYNQAMIEKAALDVKLWKMLRLIDYCTSHAIDTSGYAALLKNIQEALDKSYVELAGLRVFYEARFKSYVEKLDLAELEQKFPLGDAGMVGMIRSKRTDYYLSLYIEKLISNGFALQNEKVRELDKGLKKSDIKLTQLADNIKKLAQKKMSWDAKNFHFLIRDLSYADMTLSKKSGESPFYFATGNTGFPYRVYKDLGVDVVSINYYSSKLYDENGTIKTHSSLSEIFKQQGQKQYNAMFFPAHYHFAVPNEYIEKHLDEIPSMLRIDKNGNSPIRIRNPKFGRESQQKFAYDPNYTYYLPLSLMNPKARAYLASRVEGIKQHIDKPEIRDTLLRLELGAENVNVIVPAHDEWTRKAFSKHVIKKFGTIENFNKLWQTDFESFDDVRYWDVKGYTELQKIKIERIKREFMAIYDAGFYEDTIEQLSQVNPTLPVSNRDDGLWFRDYNYLHAQKATDLIDYHALYDRAYGHYLGNFLGKDHVTGEDLITGQSGLKTRDTAEQAFAKLMVTGWRQASWGTKSICIWNMYRDPYFIGAASNESLYSLINENWAALPQLKAVLRRFQDVLNGRIAAPKAVFFQYEAQGHTGWYMPSIYSTVSYLKARNIDYGYAFEQAVAQGKDSLLNYRVIFIPPSLFVSEELQQQMLDWVNSGGVLVTFGPFALYDEYVNPSGHFMDSVFGPAEYHLVGIHENLKNYDGIYHTVFEKPTTSAKAFKADEVKPLTKANAKLFEKMYNNPQSIRSFKLGEKQVLEEKLYLADYGKGRVIYIPREYLPAEYGPGLEKAIRGKCKNISTAWAQKEGFDIMTRFHRDDSTNTCPYVFIQNKNEWQGLGKTRISLQGTYQKAYDVSVEGGFPVKLDVGKNVTSFSVSLVPGEIAMIKLIR